MVAPRRRGKDGEYMMVHEAIGKVGIKVAGRRRRRPDAEIMGKVEKNRNTGPRLFIGKAPIKVAKHTHDAGCFDFHSRPRQILRVGEGVQLRQPR